MNHSNGSHDIVRDQNPTDVRLTTERKAQLVALVELDWEMTIDELMFVAGAYEDLASRKHEQRMHS